MMRKTMLILSSADFSSELSLSKASLTVSNILDPDQDRRFVGPDLGLNCLQRHKQVKNESP